MPAVSRQEKHETLRQCPEFLYSTRPGDGTTHYIFTDATFFRLDSAYHHALQLAARDKQNGADAQPEH